MVYYAVNSDAFELRGIMQQKFDYRESIILIVYGNFSSNKIGPHKLYYDLQMRKKEPVFIKNADHNFLAIDCRKELLYNKLS